MTTPDVQHIFNFLPISEKLATSGQPTSEQFTALRAHGYEVVINLAPDNASNAIANEAQVVSAQGMDYVHIPVDWQAPQLEDLQKFFATLEENRGRKTLVHCAMNLRVSSFVYLYRVLRESVPEPEAAVPLNEMWGRVAARAQGQPADSVVVATANMFYQPDGTWRRFIDQALSAKFWC
jgi:uncharacterized protein (TIGR01244 family)